MYFYKNEGLKRSKTNINYQTLTISGINSQLLLLVNYGIQFVRTLTSVTPGKMRTTFR